jgi:hypothetical protein
MVPQRNALSSLLPARLRLPQTDASSTSAFTRALCMSTCRICVSVQPDLRLHARHTKCFVALQLRDGVRMILNLRFAICAPQQAVSPSFAVLLPVSETPSCRGSGLNGPRVVMTRHAMPQQLSSSDL